MSNVRRWPLPTGKRWRYTTVGGGAPRGAANRERRDIMMRLKEIGHVLLRVLDLERSKKFYSEVLGFRVLEEDPEHGGTFMALPGQSHSIDLFPVQDAGA